MFDGIDALQIATRLFDAVEKGDLQALKDCYTPDAVLRIYAAGADMGRAQILELVGSLSDAIPDFRYDDVRQAATTTGFVRQHTMVGTSPAGVPFAIPACCIGRLHEAQVEFLEEYGDSAQMSALGL